MQAEPETKVLNLEPISQDKPPAITGGAGSVDRSMSATDASVDDESGAADRTRQLGTDDKGLRQIGPHDDTDLHNSPWAHREAESHSDTGSRHAADLNNDTASQYEADPAKEEDSVDGIQPPVAPVGPGQMVGRYELIHKIGHGGMATVYLGRATGRAGFEKLVAVKVIHPHLAAESEFVDMFLDEARIAARLHHPNVVEIYDLGEDQGRYFMVMEYVEGDTLSSLLRALRKKDESLPLSAVLQIAADACEGLAAAHALTDREGHPLDLVHRDVSPHNLLVGMDGRVKVVDFGIMKAAGKRSSTLTGQLRGKLSYMSPEQARCETIDHRTDLFALGAVLWELCANQRLFVADTEAEILKLVTRCEVPDVREFQADLPEGLVDLLSRSLAPHREDRFASAEEMLRDVRMLQRQLDPDIDPRRDLAQIMERYFSPRVEYIRRAIRRRTTGGYAAIPGDSTTSSPLPQADRSRTSKVSHDTVSRPHEAARPSSSMPQAAVSLVSAPSHQTLTTSVVTTPARQWAMWLLLPLVGAVLGVAFAGPGLRRTATPVDPVAQPAGKAEPRPSLASAGSETSRPRPVAPQKQIKIWLDGQPRGATVKVNGEPFAKATPTGLPLPYSEEVVEIVIEKPGFRSVRRSVMPMNSQSLNYELKPLPNDEEGKTSTSSMPRFKARQPKGHHNKGHHNKGHNGSKTQTTADEPAPMPDFSKAFKGDTGSP